MAIETTLKQSGADTHILALGGKEYEYGALTIGVMAKVLSWARGVLLARTNEAIEESGLPMSAPAVAAMVDSATRKIQNMSTMDPDFVAIVGSTDGTLRIVWCCIADRQGTTFESFRDAACANPEAMRSVCAALEVAAHGTPFQLTKNAG